MAATNQWRHTWWIVRMQYHHVQGALVCYAECAENQYLALKEVSFKSLSNQMLADGGEHR